LATGDSLFSQRTRRAIISSQRDMIVVASSLSARRASHSARWWWWVWRLAFLCMQKGKWKGRWGYKEGKCEINPDAQHSESQMRYDTCITLSYRNDSHDSLGLRYTCTICIVNLMTRTVSYDTYRVSYDTNFYGGRLLDFEASKSNYKIGLLCYIIG
jgi:hypothetical protein